jgi:hypothetical protein
LVCTRWSGQAAPTCEVQLEHARAVDRQRSAQRRQHLGQQVEAPRLLERLARRAAERRAGGALGDERRGAVDRVERGGVGLDGGRAPGHQAVLGEQDQLGRRLGGDGVGDQL